MKQLACVICAVGAVLFLHAQTGNIFLATDKTTSLVFPYSISHVDRGTRDVLVEPVKEAANILLVKAACKDFPQTNLSVVTIDGSIYSFLVSYGEAKSWIYRFAPQKKAPLSSYAASILDNPQALRGLKDRSWHMTCRMIGIYIKEDVIYYQVQLDNQSAVDYDIDFLRFFIRDRKTKKRTSLQEIELTPLYSLGNTERVKAGACNTIVIALDKFTIPDDKYLSLQIGEKNGARNLELRVGNKKIIRAIPLPDLQ